MDLDRVIAVGHSAGGHLGLWLAARPRLAPEDLLHTAEPLDVHGVLGLAPAADLAFLYREDGCYGVIDSLMGGSPAEFPERYRVGSPGELAPLGVPQRLVIGRHDSAFAPVGRRYFDQAYAAGDDVHIIEAEESGHFEMIDPATSTAAFTEKASNRTS